MKNVGSDLWSPPAVSILKNRLRKTVLDALDDFISVQGQMNGSTPPPAQELTNEDADGSAESAAKDDSETNGATSIKPANSSAARNTKLIQAIFDLLYLDKMLSISTSTLDIVTFDDAITDMKKKVELEDNAIERLRKSSVDYYKRTYLLFGLLAVG